MTIEAYHQDTRGDKVCPSGTGGSRMKVILFSSKGKQFIEDSYLMIVRSSVRLQ